MLTADVKARISADMPSGGHNSIPFNQDIGDAICEWLAQGKSLKSWLDSTENTIAISARVVYRWVRIEEKFAEAYARAKEDRADTLVDEILEIADSAEGSTEVREATLQIETRKWIAEKMRPAHYGNRIDITSGGQAIGAPIKDAAERMSQILMAAMQRSKGEDVPAVTVDAKFVDVVALPAPDATLDDLLS